MLPQLQPQGSESGVTADSCPANPGSTPGPATIPVVEFPELRAIAIRVVIMSRSRQRSVTTHRLFPSATLVVPESEIASYAHISLEKVGIPDAISGVSAVRNWIVAHFPEECLVMMEQQDNHSQSTTYGQVTIPPDKLQDKLTTEHQHEEVKEKSAHRYFR